MKNIKHTILQVNSSVRTNREKRQWIDLSAQTKACMTQPEICGAAGGAISMSMKVHECPNNAGIMTTRENADSTRFSIYCKNDKIR